MPTLLFQKGCKPDPGRPPGPLKQTLLLKDALLLAAKNAGGGGADGMVKYLTQQARRNPRTFLAALARIIPLQVTATGSTQIIIEIVQRFDDEPVAGRVAGPRMLEAEVAPLPGCGGRDLCGGRATAGFKRTSAENSPA